MEAICSPETSIDFHRATRRYISEDKILHSPAVREKKFIRIVGGWSPTGSTGTSAASWPSVPAPGDYEDGEFGGMMIGRGN
jgi:hypothetical protein